MRTFTAIYQVPRPVALPNMFMHKYESGGVYESYLKQVLGSLQYTEVTQTGKGAKVYFKHRAGHL